MKTYGTLIEYRFVDGNADTITLDGKEYKADPENEGEPLKDEDGNPVPVDANPAPDEGKDGGDSKGGDDKGGDDKNVNKDPSALTLEELKKLNPEVAKLANDSEQARQKLEEAEAQRQKAEEEELKKRGEWQTLAENEKKRAEEKASEAAKANKLLEGYKGTIKTLLESVVAQIPEDKRHLIPEDYSDRKQLEYISKNQQWFGVTLANAGSTVPNNDSKPPTDEEGQLQTELSELIKKENRTYTEDNRMLEVSQKLKEIRANKEKNKKT